MKRRCLRAAVLAVGLPLLSSQPCLSHAGDDGPWQLDAGVTLARNDNIGNAERSRDIVDDNFAILTLGAGYRWQFDMQQSLFARGFLETEQFAKLVGGAHRWCGSMRERACNDTAFFGSIDSHRETPGGEPAGTRA